MAAIGSEGYRRSHGEVGEDVMSEIGKSMVMLGGTLLILAAGVTAMTRLLLQRDCSWRGCCGPYGSLSVLSGLQQAVLGDR